MNIFQAIVLAIIEGITEFLPVSSTGHMVVASSVMGIAHDDFTKLFTITIQLGAIVSVIVLYWKRFFQTLDFYFKLIVAFIPAAICGLLFANSIDALLENATVVGFMLIAGGIVFLFIDNMFKTPEAASKDVPTHKNAFIIGCCQCIALIPGVSRSAATIIGGLSQKLTRKAAAEFSFFLAVPTMLAATAKKVLDFYTHGLHINHHQIQLLVIGNVVAFIVALLAIKTLISILTKYGFKFFGYYRIVAGVVVLLLVFTGFHIKF